MRGKQGISVFMLSPDGLMSPFQRAQMFSLQDANIHNIAIKGMFDDCQDIVKAVQNDHAFKAKYQIGTVNSINWARVVAQVVYYFKGYFNATSSNDEQVSFCVPSGNFGNVCAGHIARQMGLPVQRLIVATNENDVLDEFFRTGAYRPRGTANTYVTSSPSMDISKASNFERFVFDLVGRDGAAVKALWADVDAGKGFDLSAKLGDAAQSLVLFPARAAMPTVWPPSVHWMPAMAWWWIPIPPTASRWRANCACRAKPLSAWKPRCRPSLPTPSAKRWTVIRRARPVLTAWKTCRKKWWCSRPMPPRSRPLSNHTGRLIAPVIV
jgi:hypothetical protein